MRKRKSVLLIAGIAIALLIIFYGCQNKPKEVAKIIVDSVAMDGSGDIYVVDTASSVIEWVGSTPGNYKHNGILKLSEGTLTVNNKNITSGKFTIDITSIYNLDQQGKDRANLESHLKEKDFFEADRFPSGSFEIKQLKKDSISQIVIGNLTLKGITQTILVPAKIKIDDSFILAESTTFSIDRTKWGITYNSGIIGTIKDDLINDDIQLKLKIVAKRKEN